MAGRRVLRFAQPAKDDLAAILAHSEAQFGNAVRDRYERLILTGLKDLLTDPERPGSGARAELGDGVRAYHLRHSRNRARAADGAIRAPRHFVIYELVGSERLIVLRILHDAMDLARHVGAIGALDESDS